MNLGFLLPFIRGSVTNLNETLHLHVFSTRSTTSPFLLNQDFRSSPLVHLLNSAMFGASQAADRVNVLVVSQSPYFGS